MMKITIDRLPKLFAAMAEKRALYMPIEKNDQVEFHRWHEEALVRLDKLNTLKSAKDLFFPQTENMMKFKMEGKAISVEDNRDPAEPFAVFGVRACDAKSLEVLDKVFLADPVDTFYEGRRENGLVITMACREPEETCFCSAFGIDAVNPAGDISCWMTDELLCWQANTEKGVSFTEELKELFEETTAENEAAVETQKQQVKEIMERLPLHDLNLEGFDGEHLLEKFESPKWAELSEACLGCGTCTFVCPTCQCYDIRDYDNGHGIQRYRCWDSCMYSDFTMMAHGTPRKTQLEKFRQRFMHKLVYFPSNNDGMYSCVGCGRCLAKCPISMNIVKVIKALGGESHE
ncbi:MAG: 4Fe-4S ferredoxin [Lachnospiraceae bacterium]|jgi:sulfhydrogenase subunit beta (sulfur reductase)|nr:4Fe-4S ferredoxin [Lachnospiraceae bacterium]